MQINAANDVVRACDAQAVMRVGLAPLPPLLPPRLGFKDASHRGALRSRSFGDRAQARDSFGFGLLGSFGITAVGRAGVKVKLCETGLHVSFDHVAGQLARDARRSVLPRTRSQLMTAENNSARVDVGFVRDVFDQHSECRRRQAGGAAELIDLIAGGFDQDGLVVIAMRFEYGA